MNMLLTFDELELLLYVRGFREINGIRMPEKDFTAVEVLLAEKHLLEEGLLETRGELFAVREDVAKIVDALGSPVSYSVLAPGPEYPMFACYYIPGCYVTTELHEHREKTLRIRSFDEAEFAVWKEEMEDDYRKR